MKLLIDFIDDSLTFGDGFALVHTARNDYDLHENEKG